MESALQSQDAPASAMVAARNTRAYRSARRDIGARTLGRFDQTNDASIVTLGRAPHRQELESLADVGRSTHDAIADLLLDGDGFAGQGRLIENGQAFYDRPVDRDHIAFSNHEAIARLDHVQVDLLVEPAVPVADCGVRYPGEERRHLPACATLGKVLE